MGCLSINLKICQQIISWQLSIDTMHRIILHGERQYPVYFICFFENCEMFDTDKKDWGKLSSFFSTTSHEAAESGVILQCYQCKKAQIKIFSLSYCIVFEFIVSY